MAKRKTITALSDLTPDTANANKGTERGRYMVEASLTETGAGRSIVADRDGRIIAGNKTLEAWAGMGGAVKVVETDGHELVVVQRTDLDLSDPKGKARKLAYYDNRAGQVGLEWDAEQLLADVNAGVDLAAMFKADEIAELLAGVKGGAEADAEPQIDQAEELNKKWQVKPGDLWRIGAHRLLCGDSTKAADVARVMGGERAALCHADPPYGMGKENEGVQNDNLYAEKLDAFQMAWWSAARPHIVDNASAYIWGNAEDLWRLWYSGGLGNRERVTFRNEIVWDKREDNPTMLVSGVPLESRRMYQPTERCLFFMLGEQGFNNNADNYWDGWEGIRSKLAADCEKMGWGAKDIERICGVGMYGHWFTKSQWTLIPAEHYRKLQTAAREHDAFKREHDAFKREHDELKREHDELKREFYATRAYFDNTHDSMTDVWSYHRVTGDDRHGHATPKPPEMIARAIKSSTDSDAIVYEPFAGSGTTLVACENLGRKCRAVEISPAYCAVILERMAQAFPKLEITRDDGAG